MLIHYYSMHTISNMFPLSLCLVPGKPEKKKKEKKKKKKKKEKKS